MDTRIHRRTSNENNKSKRNIKEKIRRSDRNMGISYIWKKNQKYAWYDDYETWQEALKQAKWHKKRNKAKYFILIVETGDQLISKKKYKLYMTKVWRPTINW